MSYRCNLCSRRLKTQRGVEQHKRAVHGKYTIVPAKFDDFLEICRRGDVEIYVFTHLAPDESFLEECRSVVDCVAEFFKRSSGFTVDRFIKGGSLGKATAIKSKSDIDCVMFIGELPSLDSKHYKGMLEDCLARMEEKLRISKESIAYSLEVVGRTSYAIQLRVKTQRRDHASHDVDLLPTSDLLGPPPSRPRGSKAKYKKDKQAYEDRKAEVYSMMDTLSSGARKNCSAALVELQRDFVDEQNEGVKMLIRLVKMWKESCVTEPSLTSYPLELLCIYVKKRKRPAAAFRAVLQKLRNYNNIDVHWTYNYSWGEVPDEIKSKRPLILDPANPYNNVADRCRDWDAVAEAARKTLRKPFFSR